MFKKSYKKVKVYTFKKDLEKAKDEAFEKKDTKIIEESLGGDAGRPTKRVYNGLFTRKKKPRRKP